MDKKYQEKEILRQIEVASRLYPDFGAIDLLKAIYGTQANFLQRHPSLYNKGHSYPSLEKVEETLAANKSLHLKGELHQGLFIDFLKELGEDLKRFQPSIKKEFPAFISFIEDYLSMEGITLWGLFEDQKSIISATPFARDLVSFIITFSLGTFYQTCYQDFLMGLDTTLWDGGYCPVCSVKPHYALLQENGGARVLECWLCSTSWNFLRIKCPFCGTIDQEKLGYFTKTDKESICRVDYCTNCNSYYKTYDVREYERDELYLPVHHLATLSWDMLARREGFLPGSGLEWVNEEELQTQEC